jgi:hypothetical protein
MLAELSHVLSPVPVVVVTGLASPGKTHFVAALERRLAPAHILVRLSGGPAFPADVEVLHVHAETDVEGMVEGVLPAGTTARGAAVVIPVDWEPPERGVNRVVDALVARGLAVVGA